MLTALAVSTALIATRGHVAAPQPPQATRPAASAVCLFQVPGSMHWINLYAVQQMNVRERERAYGQASYDTVLTFYRFDSVGIPIAPGADISTHTSAILKRLVECKEGL